MDVILRRAGMQSTIQDLGRPGYRAAGVPLSGAMDRFALRVANLLVGNEEGAPALEFTLLGPELEFTRDALIAVTGGEFLGVPLWQPVRVAAGTLLSIGPAREGCRGYLAIAGGFSASRVLGSASVYLRAGFGGAYGRALRNGDVLRAPAPDRRVADHWRIDPRILPAYSASPRVRVLRGAQCDEFGSAFFDASFSATTHFDRMGLRLKGPTLARHSREEIASSPVVPGTVQVPHDGQPIVLMADAQTVGGYPQIAHVIGVDLPLLAQLRAGDSVTFSEVTLAQAHELTLARERGLAMLRHGLSEKLS